MALLPSGRCARIVVVVVLLTLAPVVGILPAGATPVADESAATVDDTSPALAQVDDDNSSNATDAYVTERGDVVLVYDAENLNDDEDRDEEADTDELEFGDSPQDRVTLGAALGRGLVYGLLVSNRSTNSSAAANTTGGVTLLVTPDRMAGDVRLRTVRPDELRELDVDIEGERTSVNARATIDGTGTVELSGDAAAGQIAESAGVSARASFGASSLAVDARTTATFSQSPSPPLSVSATLTEDDGSYTLTVERNTTISEFEVADWRNESAARETLREQYVDPAAGVGETSLRLASYSLTNTSAGPRLAVAFTVEYTDVERSLQPALAAALADDEQLNLTDPQASRLAEEFLAAEVRALSVNATLRDGEFNSDLRLRVEGYDRPLLATADVIEAYEFEGNDTEELASVAEGFRKRFEAQRVADLTRTYTLDASYDRPTARTARVEVRATYRTDNWRAYVNELRSRNVRLLNITFDLHATARNDRVIANGSVSFHRDGLLREVAESALNASEAEPVGPDDDDSVNLSDREDLLRTLRAFREADFQVARADVNVTAERVTVEFGAKFDNASAFLTEYENESDGGVDVERIEEVVIRQNGTRGTKTYVYLDGVVPTQPSEADVRELEAVNGSTTVHMPGEWEQGSLPRLDRDRAYAYLGLEPPTPTPSPTGTVTATGISGTDTGSPGFGVTAALAALLAAALLAIRRD